MQAGVTGINTIRVYSPQKQQLDQDPKALFIKKWIPELRKYTAAEIINFEKIMFDFYPKPIKDWNETLKRMKDSVYKIKKSDSAKMLSEAVLIKHASRKRRIL